MEEELDLRPYIRAVLKNWYWIAAAGLVAAIAALIATTLLGRTYEATALVSINTDRQLVQFDPRIQSEEEQQPLQAYPELATVDALLIQLMADLNLPSEEIGSVHDLRKKLSAAAGSDPSIVRLTASYDSPETAARIANAWAAMYVEWVNTIYSDSDGKQLAFFESQLAAANEDLTTAEAALVAFESRNRLSIVNNQLSALNTTQAAYLSNRQQITFLLDDIQGLRNQIEQGGGTAVNLADQLAALNLQLRSFNASGGSAIQLQLDPETPLTTESRSELTSNLDSLTATLNNRLVALETSLTDLEPQILALQAEKRALTTESSQLNRDVTVAEETYTILARKVDEERITSQDTISQVRLVSESAVPVEPSGMGRLSSMVLAGVVGVLVAVGVLFVQMWWVGEAEQVVGTAVPPKRTPTAKPLRRLPETDPAGD